MTNPSPCGKTVTLVSTGVSNLASITAAFERMGARIALASTAEDIKACDALVLPGVGHFQVAKDGLVRHGFWDALRERARSGRPMLGVCVGMQLFLDGSDEAPDEAGLGVIPGRAERFDTTDTSAALRCPHMGWNALSPAGDAGKFLDAGPVYFANSYRLKEPPPGWRTYTADHGGAFVAAVEKDNVLACQFHPELSGALGRAILERWLSCS